MTLDAIKQEIFALSNAERESLLILEDFAEGGRGQFLLDEARSSRTTGGSVGLNEFLQSQRSK